MAQTRNFRILRTSWRFYSGVSGILRRINCPKGQNFRVRSPEKGVVMLNSCPRYPPKSVSRQLLEKKFPLAARPKGLRSPFGNPARVRGVWLLVLWGATRDVWTHFCYICAQKTDISHFLDTFFKKKKKIHSLPNWKVPMFYAQVAWYKLEIFVFYAQVGIFTPV